MNWWISTGNGNVYLNGNKNGVKVKKEKKITLFKSNNNNYDRYYNNKQPQVLDLIKVMK